ncbi:MAG TPA: methylenetetrahydrofolate reductase [Vicinamibacterales bacterium]|nr:methylenetetrahydrofolate reductase [Vicinamibacterales bacterium]
MSILEALRGGQPVIAAELRPPRAELDAARGMDAWIDTYHAVRRLVRGGTHVFLTDSAVGLREEDNLRHLVTNLGTDVPRARIVPFLTCKHTLDYCLQYAERAWQHGFPALVVLGGDRSVGPPRCVPHAWQLRRAIRARRPDLVLGGWANPHADPARQVDYLLDQEATADFFLTQVVSHHDAGKVERFVAEAQRRGLALPGIFGVFFYRSANRQTLERLSALLPVPVERIAAEFARGDAPEAICARTLRALREAGAEHFYISNLPPARAQATLAAILERAGLEPARTAR